MQQNSIKESSIWTGKYKKKNGTTTAM